mmetsp:Transcript_18938/g.38054  ORF Transcript_18938/g.38054 Transcript_18938/m.38054 type:complete len:88 (+) Transcript_18938:154-417(+)
MVHVLRATKDGSKYIIQVSAPAAPKNNNAPMKWKVHVLPTKLIFSAGVPVECFGLVNAHHVNGKRAKVQSFLIKRRAGTGLILAMRV